MLRNAQQEAVMVMVQEMRGTGTKGMKSQRAMRDVQYLDQPCTALCTSRKYAKNIVRLPNRPRFGTCQSALVNPGLVGGETTHAGMIDGV